MNATDLAARLRRDPNPAVARHIAWAERRGHGEELRLLDPFVAAGLVEQHGDELSATLEGLIAVGCMLHGGHAAHVEATV